MKKFMKYMHNALLAVSIILTSPVPAFPAIITTDLFLQANTSLSDGKDQYPEQGYAADFQPAGGSMATDSDRVWGINFRFGIEPSITVGDDWHIGVISWQNFANLSSSITGEQRFFTSKRIVSETTVDWWDTVTAVDLVLDTDTPAFGIAASKNKIKYIVALQRYELIRRDYIGVDRSGKRNTSDVKNKIEIGDGYGQIHQFWYRIDTSPDAQHSSTDAGIYYERYGSDAWFFGFGIRIKHSLFR